MPMNMDEAIARVAAVDQALTDAAENPRWQVESAVRRLALAAGADERERPAWPGAHSTISYVEPIRGLRAALMVQRHAARVVENYVRDARGEGVEWRVIGQALDLAKEAEEKGRPLGELAYDFVVGEPDRWREPSFHYRCGSCEQMVTDRGPYNSYPGDNERGHG